MPDLSQPGGAAESPQTLVDPYGRRLHYLRLSVTDRCNFRCVYCMPAGGMDKLNQNEILSLEELARVAQTAVDLGVDKIRLTGGEPLVRRDLDVLLRRLDRLRPRPDLRITTNGFHLARFLPTLLECGVSTVNISLDTLDPERYGRIVGLGAERGREAFARVWEGVQAALESRGLRVKINVVLLAGLNADQPPAFARLAQEAPLAVRFIEYMPVGRRKSFDRDQFISSEQVLEQLGELGELEPLPSLPGDGPARRYRLPGAQGELGVISAVSSHFCGACNRLRLSADGRLVPCLFSSRALDLKPMLRAGCSHDDLVLALHQAAAAKPLRHGQNADSLQASGCPMSRLGG